MVKMLQPAGGVDRCMCIQEHDMPMGDALYRLPIAADVEPEIVEIDADMGQPGELLPRRLGFLPRGKAFVDDDELVRNLGRVLTVTRRESPK